MRVIAGTLKGRKFKVLDEPGLRPTTDMVRGAIFSALQTDLELNGARVLDLYAGTGAVGIEALSRGADYCVFVEYRQKLAKNIQLTLDAWGLKSRARVLSEKVESSAKLLKASMLQPFNLVFADPPYEAPFEISLLSQFCSAGLISADSLVVIETHKDGANWELGVELEGTGLFLELLKDKTYGATRVSFLKLRRRD